MSSSDKSPETVRHGGPGASHENAKRPPDTDKGQPHEDNRRRSDVSGGGGERDSHHTHDPHQKGDRGGSGR